MDVIKKINLKMFIPLSILSTIGFCVFAKSWTEVGVIFMVYIATLVNLYMLMFVGASMLFSEEIRIGGKIDKVKVVVFFLLKFILLFAALTLGVHFIGNRIILGLLNYVLQIFVLCISMWSNLK